MAIDTVDAPASEHSRDLEKRSEEQVENAGTGNAQPKHYYEKDGLRTEGDGAAHVEPPVSLSPLYCDFKHNDQLANINILSFR
jgi:hypothetical protein